MTILFVGSTPEDIASPTYKTSTGVDTNYTNWGVGMGLDTAGWDYRPQLTGSSADFWFHSRVYYNYRMAEANLATADGIFLIFYDTSNAEIARIELNNGQYYAQTGGVNSYNASDSSTFWNAATATKNLNYTFDVHIVSNGSSVVVDMYVNEVLESSATYTGTAYGEVAGCRIILQDIATTSSNTIFSEMVMTDGEDTISWRVAMLETISDGFHGDYSGDYTDLDVFATGTRVSDTLGDKESWIVDAYGGDTETENYSVISVVNKLSTVVRLEGPQNAKLFTRIGGVDYSDTTKSADTKDLMQQMTVNPATGVTWLTSELAALEFGIETIT